ncbi:MAG: DUF2384 domain-containing protein [Desulfuromonadales bacterium]|nr:DUF2384 domain-containing protein [Pseudomonadota bacterium]MCK4623136.1 DUF2384 domain-containing protein [Desulfuromonadales bacterium]
MSSLAQVLEMPDIGETLPEMIAAARKGVPMRAIGALAEFMSLSLQEVAEILPVSYRTLKRYTPNHILTKDLSAHVLELGRVFIRASEVLQDENKARLWLTRPCQALGGVEPISMLDTPLGIEAVLDELVRIEHGVYY